VKILRNSDSNFLSFIHLKSYNNLLFLSIFGSFSKYLDNMLNVLKNTLNKILIQHNIYRIMSTYTCMQRSEHSFWVQSKKNYNYNLKEQHFFVQNYQ